MKVLNKLNDMGVTLETLYNGKKQILINLSDKPYTFNVILVDRSNKPDCKISSFGANLWARTPKGINYEKYNSLGTLQSSLVRLIKNKVETNGDVVFSITDDVYTF
jgi:hypothetical protein